MGGDHGVRVVRRGHQHRIDVLAHLVEQDAPVLEALRGRVVAERLLGVGPVHVAEGDDVLRRHVGQVAPADAADADAGDVQLVAGGDVPQSLAEDVARDDGEGHRAGAQRRAGLDEFSSCVIFHMGMYFVLPMAKSKIGILRQ